MIFIQRDRKNIKKNRNEKERKMSVFDESLKLHEKNKGKIEVISKVKVENMEDLSLAYSPGVAEPCKRIAENKENVYKYT